jgi:hypothetical protein
MTMTDSTFNEIRRITFTTKKVKKGKKEDRIYGVWGRNKQFLEELQTPNNFTLIIFKSIRSQTTLLLSLEFHTSSIPLGIAILMEVKENFSPDGCIVILYSTTI